MGRRRKRRKRKRNGDGDGDSSPKDLPYEIVSDILSRLSVKSLVQFRRVSKYWCSIMSDQSFVDSLFTRSHARPDARYVLMSLSTYLKPGLSFFTTDHQHQTLNPVGFLNQNNLLVSKVSESLNGIIFLEHDETIHACNFSTRETLTLPNSNQGPVSVSSRMLSLFSFGYDPVANQYKVLKTWVEFSSEHGSVTMHKVLTVGTDSWRPVKCSSSIEIPKEESVCINGAIHFRTSDLLGNMVIMAFDVGAEEFRTITLPSPASNLGHKSTLMKLKDCVTVLDYDQLVDFSSMKMWILEDYKNQVWTEKQVMLPFYWNELRGNCVNFLVSSVYSGEIVLTPRLVGNSLSVFYYDMESNNLRKVELPGRPEDICQAAGPYFIKIPPVDCLESILSPREFRF